MPRVTGREAVKIIFFGNYFYGLCAVALAVETSLQQHYPVNSIYFYIWLFTGTTLYYSKAYLVTEVSRDVTNARSAWYLRHRKTILQSLLVMAVLMFGAGMMILFQHWPQLLALRTYEWALLFIFPLISVLYYGIQHGGKAYNIRKVGWLKPFVIGFIWAGSVSVYPILFQDMSSGRHYSPEPGTIFLFVKNFMFITLLCIMFDIKDYVMDYNTQLKTFVVKLGPRRTIWLIIMPLALLGLASFLSFAFLQNFDAGKVLINTLPFILLLWVGVSLRKQRSIFYYLVIIDGLMLVKAACGILGMLVL